MPTGTGQRHTTARHTPKKQPNPRNHKGHKTATTTHQTEQPPPPPTPVQGRLSQDRMHQTQPQPPACSSPPAQTATSHR